MSRTQPPDEADDLVEWLRANVDLSVVDAPDLDIGHPNFEGGVDTPSVRVQAPESDTLGGETGYSGMSPGGEGPTQDVRTTVQVDCWGGTENDRARLDAHPSIVAAQLRTVIWGAILESPPPDGYQYWSVVDTSSGNDTDATPTEYRQILFVAMGYSLRPPSNYS